MSRGEHCTGLSRVRWVGLGGDGQETSEGMRKYRDYITEATNDEGGVGEVIEKFILNPADNR